MKRIRPYLFSILLLLVSVSFFLPALFQGKLLLPADTIIGLYHPYRDMYASTNPNGVPYKNSLITDPVRQQYPWKYLSISEEKHVTLPTWNAYAMAGYPLLANIQSAVLYPLNIIFWVLPFSIGWNVFIVLQVLLGSLFMYLYLRNLSLTKSASFLGAFVFVYSGFAVAWLEWGNILHTALWLPLILLAIDQRMGIRKQTKEEHAFRNNILWPGIVLFAFTASFFAGHLQTFFYLLLTSSIYLIGRWHVSKKRWVDLLPFVVCAVLFVLTTIPQWVPTLQFLNASARSIDQADYLREGWFIPWQHAVQFVAPDFFGNPTTLNYFGVWNYAEFIGYIGMLPLILSIYAVVVRHDKKTYFFVLLVLFCILFAFPTILAYLPYRFSVPFISTAQPTRLLFLIDFALSVLAALGLDYLIKEKRSHLKVLLIPIFIIVFLWAVIFFMPSLFSINSENLVVTKRNMQLPTLLFVFSSILLIAFMKLRKKQFQHYILIGIIAITVFDLFRFTQKFTPFTNVEYLYPVSQSIAYLQKQIGHNRFMSLDSRILPPNFSLMYGLQTIEGYDPLYLRRYGELISASERGKPDISPPFGFNRIITPHRYDSPIIHLLGVKYILSLSDIQDPSLTLVFREGETRIYENTKAFPRVFMVNNVVALGGENKTKAIEFLFKESDLKTTAVVESALAETEFASGSAEIVSFSPSKVKVSVETQGEGFLVFTDSYYPTWRATLLTADDTPVSDLTIHRTDYHFRGVIVPDGKHIVEFTNTL